jgi:hypothetical protein
MALALAIAAAGFSAAVAADGPIQVNKLPVLSGRQVITGTGPLTLGDGVKGGGEKPETAEVCEKPIVKALLVGGKVKPGDSIIIGGCGFGASLGQAFLVGDFAGGKAQLIVDSWSDTGIGARVPEGLSGAPDQLAGVQVVTKAGAKSNKDKTLAFEARRERKMITASDTDYECTTSEGADYVHYCKTGGQLYGSAPCGNTVCQQHKSRPFPAGPFNGKDDFVLHLKNGYEYAAVEFWPNSGADFAIPVTPPVGPKPKLEILKKGADAPSCA